MYLQTDAVPAPDVELKILHNRLRDATTLSEEKLIIREIDELRQVMYDHYFLNCNNRLT